MVWHTSPFILSYTPYLTLTPTILPSTHPIPNAIHRCGTTSKQRAAIQTQYETDLTAVLQTIKTEIPNVFLSIGGPWTQGEGYNKCNNLPEYDYKIGIYNQYVGINRRICTQENVPYMDFR